jgi:hypothetical protein
MDQGRMVKRGGGYERVEVRRGEVRKRTDVPLQYERMGTQEVVGPSGLKVVGCRYGPWR